MEGKGLVYEYRGNMYFYREYKDGTSNVFPLMNSGISGVLYFNWDRPALSPLYTPPIREWITYPKYKLGWMDLSYPRSPYICIRIVLYWEERVSDYYKKRMLPTMKECLDYAYEHAVSTGRILLIDGLGNIHKSNGCVHISRQSSYMYRLVE